MLSHKSDCNNEKRNNNNKYISQTINHKTSSSLLIFFLFSFFPIQFYYESNRPEIKIALTILIIMPTIFDVSIFVKRDLQNSYFT